MRPSVHLGIAWVPPGDLAPRPQRQLHGVAQQIVPEHLLWVLEQGGGEPGLLESGEILELENLDDGVERVPFGIGIERFGGLEGQEERRLGRAGGRTPEVERQVGTGQMKDRDRCEYGERHPRPATGSLCWMTRLFGFKRHAFSAGALRADDSRVQKQPPPGASVWQGQ